MGGPDQAGLMSHSENSAFTVRWAPLGDTSRKTPAAG